MAAVADDDVLSHHGLMGDAVDEAGGGNSHQFWTTVQDPSKTA